MENPMNKLLKLAFALATCALFAVPAYAAAATLTLSPASNTVSIGQTFTVDVLLDTSGQAVDGVDVHYLNYNPYFLQLQDSDATTPGTQVMAGALMPSTLTNQTDVTNGKIDFSQITASGSKYTGSGTLAKLTFKALVAGSTRVSFDYSSGNTTDSNIASAGGDILTSVTDAQVAINYPTTPVNAGDTASSTPTNPSPTSPQVSLKLVNYQGTYYLIISGIRHGITLPGMLFSYGFALNQAKIATAEDMALPEGDILLPGDGVLVKTTDDKTVWLISNNQRHGFVSEQVFTALGFKFSQVLVVTAPELDKQNRGPNLDNGQAQHLPGIDINVDGTIYWIGYDGRRYPYPSLEIFNSWHIPNDFTRVLPANNADRSLPAGSSVSKRILN
jgi:hypothetical protein